MRRSCFSQFAFVVFAASSPWCHAQFTANDTQYRAIALPSVSGSQYYFSGSPITADFNGDGHPDLAIAVAAANNNSNPTFKSGFIVLLGDGKGSFRQLPVVLPQTNHCAASGVTCEDFHLVAGDFNGDGKQDLIFAETVLTEKPYTYVATEVALLYLGKGDGTFLSPTDISSYVGNDVAAADLRHVGKLDLVSDNSSGGSTLGTNIGLIVALGNGDGTFQKPVILPAADDPSGYQYNTDSFAIGDLGNGHLDIVAGTSGLDPTDIYGAGYSVYLGNGDGSFQAPLNNPAVIPIDDVDGFQASIPQVELGNFGPDHKVGMLIVSNQATSGGNSLYGNFLPGNGDGTFGSLVLLGGASYEAAGDINGDGVDDAVFSVSGYDEQGEPGLSSIQWNLDNGDGTFAASSQLQMNPPANSPCLGKLSPAPWLVLSDLTGGGRLDGVAAFGGTNCLAVLFNAGTTTTLRSSANPGTFLSPLTLTATVSGAILKAGSPLSPPGGVSFYDNGKLLGARPVNSGQATMANLVLPIGTHTLTATYSGDFSYLASTSASLTEVVTGIPTAISLTSSTNPLNHDNSVTFTATITAPGGGKQPTSTSGIGVYFYDGDKVIAARAVDASGTATITTKFVAGMHTISVKYLGDSYWAPSTSNIVSEQVN